MVILRGFDRHFWRLARSLWPLCYIPHVSTLNFHTSAICCFFCKGGLRYLSVKRYRLIEMPRYVICNFGFNQFYWIPKLSRRLSMPTKYVGTVLQRYSFLILPQYVSHHRPIPRSNEEMGSRLVDLGLTWMSNWKTPYGSEFKIGTKLNYFLILNGVSDLIYWTEHKLETQTTCMNKASVQLAGPTPELRI